MLAQRTYDSRRYRHLRLLLLKINDADNDVGYADYDHYHIYFTVDIVMNSNGNN